MNALKLINFGSNELKYNNIRTHKLDSELLLSKILNKKREEIIANLKQKIDLKKINEFNNFLNSIYKKKFINHENSKYYISEQSLDSLIKFAKNEFQLLEPFGNDNFSPIFLIKKIKILKFKIINDYHLQLLIKNDLKKTCLCFAFNSVGSKIGEILMNSKKNLDLIVQINNKIVQKNSDFNLIIKDAIV